MGTCEHDIKDAYEQLIPKTLKALLAKQTKIMYYSDSLMSWNCSQLPANSSGWSYAELMRLNLPSEWCHLKDTFSVEWTVKPGKMFFVLHISLHDLMSGIPTIWLL